MKKKKVTWQDLTINEKIGAIIIEFVLTFIIFILPFILYGVICNIWEV